MPAQTLAAALGLGHSVTARARGISLPGQRFGIPRAESLVGTHPALADLMRRVHGRHRTLANYALRNLVDQQLFWDCAQVRKKTGKCPPRCNRSQCASANPPGQSNHEFGLAVDAEPFDGRVAAWQAIVIQEGGRFVIDKEPWHMQLKATPSARFSCYPDGWRP